MLELLDVRQLSLPVTRVLVSSTENIKEIAHNILDIDGKLLDASDITKCDYKNSNYEVINNTSDFFNLTNSTKFTSALFVDFINKRIFRGIRSIEIKYSYKLIIQIEDSFIRVDTIPHPIRHNDADLQQAGIGGRTLYAKLAFLNKKIYYVSVHSNKEVGYRRKI